MIRSLASALAGAAIASALSAQVTAPIDPVTRGYASSFRVGFALQGETYPNSNTQTSILFERMHADPSGTISVKTFDNIGAPALPVGDMRVIAAWMDLNGGVNTELEVDGISTGNARLPLLWNTAGNQGQGHFEFHPDWNGGTNNPWMALFFSKGGSGEIHGYYPPQFALPSPMYGNVLLEQAVTDFTPLPGNTPPITPQMLSSSASLTAFDMHIGTILDTGGGIQNGLIETTDSIFFSLTSASASNLGAITWPNPKPAGFATPTWVINGSTIFRATWSGTQVSVEVVHDHETLNLDPHVNIDALAVGSGFDTPFGSGGRWGTNGMFYVYSCELDDSLPSQFMCHADVFKSVNNNNTAPRGGPLRDVNGGALETSLSLGNNDEIGGLCAQDPESTTNSYGVMVPVNNPNKNVRRLGFSGVRYWALDSDTLTPSQTSWLKVAVSGWAAPTPITSVRHLFLQIRVAGQSALLGETFIGKRLANVGRIEFAGIEVPAHFDSGGGDYEVRVMQRDPATEMDRERTYWARLRKLQ